ncbi:hypothetical protein LOC67_10725 [Stieleria sp. JC731]|uniref:hypothetical protein n=1 Tax=Pirellulaceae TaxID=2691357 RepID=UPI001E6080A8|nr:hypothetical protein [Stieleria sp. JC731]MCC9601019.1 hypothetical protein [Stieleria sp. JC731]
MDKTIRTFDTHKEAERAAYDDDAKLSTSERLANFFKMMAPVYGSSQRLQRVYRTRNLDEPEVRDHWRMGL